MPVNRVLVLLDLKKNSGDFSHRTFSTWRQIQDKILMYWIYNKKPFPAENVFWIILNFWHDIKKLCFDIHFDVFRQKSSCGATLPTLPSACFYCYYRLPEGGRSPAGQWSAFRHAPVSVQIIFWSLAAESAEGDRFSVGSALLLFLSGQLALRCSEQNHETIAFYYTTSKDQGRQV